MFQANVSLDESSLESFIDALVDYASSRNKEHGKSYEYALNRSAKDVAARAAQFTYHADVAALKVKLDASSASKILAARYRRAHSKIPKQPIWDMKVQQFVK